MNEPLHILIVDDNEMMVKTLQDILRIKGYEVETAYSGSEALEKAENNLFDCVISDIKMPEGVEVVELMHGEGHDQPVVSIHMPRAVVEETEEEEAGEAEAAAETEAEAKPAEGEEG